MCSFCGVRHVQARRMIPTLPQTVQHFRFLSQDKKSEGKKHLKHATDRSEFQSGGAVSVVCMHFNTLVKKKREDYALACLLMRLKALDLL